MSKKRIGLALASIHTGSAPNVWYRFARDSLLEDLSLFIFPGGRLDAKASSEYLRNSVYSLANKENLDGLISWSSAIGYTVSKEEFDAFHQAFEPLPYVTIGHKMEGHPCIDFDAYNGTKNLVTHFITLHGCRKIAFLRGPASHHSAQARYRGYCDALKEAGIPYREGDPLVSDPFSWNSGDAAAEQLYKARRLIPGKDFEALIGSSDMMVFAAIEYFERFGYRLPADYRAGGFNNSVESRILQSPLSTVHMPYRELSREAFRIIKILLKKTKNLKDSAGDASIDDVNLESEVIIRESCGCGMFEPSSEAGLSVSKSLNPEEAVSAIGSYAADCLSLDESEKAGLVMPVVRALFDDVSLFLGLFEKVLPRFFDSGRDADVLVKIIAWVYSSGLIPEELYRKLTPELYRRIIRAQERIDIRKRYESEFRNTALNILKNELLGTKDRSSLVQSLVRHLPKIGISTASLILYGDEKISICAGSFSPQGLSPNYGRQFPASQLFPPELKSSYGQGVFMVQPLFIENQSLGYFIHNVPFYDGVIYEELRSAISYALKGIELFEDAMRARKIAEQAEQSRTDFFVALGNELYDPFTEAADALDSLESALRLDEVLPPDVLSRLRRLKSRITDQQDHIGSLMDLSLAPIDGLSLRRSLFSLEDIFPGTGSFPLLCGDKAKLAQCFSLLAEQFGADVSGRLEHTGLAVHFRGGKSGSLELRQRHASVLAERIILMHGGLIRIEGDTCTVLLPWPSILGAAAQKQSGSRNDHILCMSDPALLPDLFFDLPVLTDAGKALDLPGRTAMIVWFSESGGMDDFVKISALCRHQEFLSVPFLCYGRNLSGESIADSVDSVIRAKKAGTILFVAMPSDSYEELENDFEVIHIPSMTAFNDTVASITPSLVIFNTLNIEAAAAVRRHPLTVRVPIIMVPGKIDSPADILVLSQYSRLIICNASAAPSPEFLRRIRGIIAGDEILPPHTGALVKKAILYFNQHGAAHISRWKLADSVNVSEDYLTRIFHREMGLPLWEYLNRYRVFLAAERLLQSDESIQEVALSTGFQDQAYFCRVFKKIYGIPPGQLRKSKKSE
ncbi:helix-turn-helix domain-containing protein [Treponema sp. OttesenSCG-928-L16]|nr:helix-turn-helix domain-containing protein [Treponema sp. OttesenSCG-928-L16]